MPTSVTADTALTLPDILPNAYVLPYAIPLLLLSIKVNFLGAFLTLDRTRTFAPIEKTPIFNDRRPWWRLEGGLGGLASGWLCGLHLTTYLALLILNKSNLSLSGLQFLVIWLLVSGLFAFLGGRWRIAASIFFALVASASFCSLINIIFLPHSLLPRLIVYAILAPLLIFGTLVPHTVIRHSTLRTCSALTGSAGIVISIALFTKVPSWTSPWLTLAISPYVGNRDSHEKGLSAALCVLAVAGAAVDWLCKLKLGENPDKEWDAYLAKYSQSFPFSSNRVGTFQPYESFWARLFKGHLFTRRSASDQDILFPPDSQLLPTSAKPHTEEELEKAFTGTPPPSFRPYPFTTSRKPTLLSKGKTRSALKGGILSDTSDSDSSDDDTAGPPKFKPWLMKRASTANSAATTLVPQTPGDIGGLTPPPEFAPNGGVEDYSDVEVDVTSAAAAIVKQEKEREKERNSPGWKPGFLKKHEEEVQRRASLKGSLKGKEPERELDNGSVGSTASLRLTESPTPLSRHASSSASRGLANSSQQQSRLAPPTPNSLPATPSLIRAYERINRARGESVASASPSTPNANPSVPSTPQVPQIDSMTNSGTGSGSPALAIDDGFWEHLRAKAAEFKPTGHTHTPRR